MTKLLLLSVVLAFVLIPAVVAKMDRKRPEKGLRRTVQWMIAFNLFYASFLFFLHGRL